jgi:hypothetical protein
MHNYFLVLSYLLWKGALEIVFALSISNVVALLWLNHVKGDNTMATMEVG